MEHYTAGEGFEGVSEEARANVSKHDTMAETVEAYHELTQKLGKSFRLPDDLSTLPDDQKAELTTRIKAFHSVPDSPDGYKFKHADGVKVNADMEKAFKALAHETDMSPMTAQRCVDWWNGLMTDMAKAKADKDAEIIKTGKKTLDDAGFTKKDFTDIQTMLAFYVTDDPTTDEGKAAVKELAAALERTELGSMTSLMLALKQIHGDLIAEGKTFESAEAKGAKTGGLTYPAMERNLEK
jgi:hypothetical protein